MLFHRRRVKPFAGPGTVGGARKQGFRTRMASILLLNTSFQNKGDALMTRAIQDRLGPDHDWSVTADVALMSRRETRTLRICLMSDLPGLSGKRRLFNRLVAGAASLMRLLPKPMRLDSVVLPGDLDLALDVSGYCFGDPWGQGRVDHAARNYRQLKAAGAKIVLMPKTWGPFSTISSESLDALLDPVDLAFARDRRSLEEIGGRIGVANRKKLFFAPDYTHAVAPDPAAEPGESKIAYLVPSSRVIDSGTLSRDRYLTLLANAREALAGAGLKPRLLIHETANDLAFIEAAEAMGFAPEDIVVAGDAIAAKSLIAQSAAVVTSRLHGLYNALNSRVPVAVVAWSFKYEEALAHYNCPECLVDLADAEQSLRRIIGMITDPEEVLRLKAAMLEGKRAVEAETEAMWERIEALVDDNKGAATRAS